MGGIIALIVIAALVIILAVAYVAIYNGLVQLRNRVEEAYSCLLYTSPAWPPHGRQTALSGG